MERSEGGGHGGGVESSGGGGDGGHGGRVRGLELAVREPSFSSSIIGAYGSMMIRILEGYSFSPALVSRIADLLDSNYRRVLVGSR